MQEVVTLNCDFSHKNKSINGLVLVKFHPLVVTTKEPKIFLLNVTSYLDSLPPEEPKKMKT